MNKQRDITIDLLKAIGIIAVVAFHCNLLPGFFFLFHNPLFMFAAGLFHPREASTICGGGYYKYLKKRFLRIYLPFVFLMAFLTLIQPLLVKLWILPETPYTLREIPMKLLTILAMRVEGFSGPCWFLISLLEISITFETFRLFTHHLPSKWEMSILFAISIILFPIGVYTNLPRVLDESAILFIWYVLGFYMKIHIDFLREWQQKLSSGARRLWLVGVGTICIILSYCMFIFSRHGYGWCCGAFPPLIAIGTFMGIMWSYGLATMLNYLSIAILLAVPGRVSFAIMAWHLGAFRLLSVVRVLMGTVPRGKLVLGYVYEDGMWSAVYCLFGILLPCMGKICWDQFLCHNQISRLMPWYRNSFFDENRG